MTTAAASDVLTTRRADADGVVIKCVGLTKLFKDFWMRNRVRAVDGIELEVRKGEVFGLLGPNGSGKSTTIKMILGLLHPTAGRIAVFGKRPEDVDSKKMIGYLPEESYLYRFLNARETLDYYGRLFHQSRPQRQRRIDMLLEMVGLDAAWRRPVGEYSKGMQRRIGLAQALINDPQLLILDEPTTGLDPIGTRQIKDLILELKSRGKTILLCSHLLADVEDVTDRACIMFGGKIRALGTCAELLTDTDVTNIETDRLPKEAIAEIEAVLQRHGHSITAVKHPRQRLEELFLDIVNRAQAEGEATSGAKASAKIADFLRLDGDSSVATPVQGEAVLERLTSAQPTPPAPTRADSAAVSPVPPPPAAQPKQALLDELVSGRREAPAAPASSTPPAAKPDAPASKPAAAPNQSLIDSLVQKPKDGGKS